MRVRWRNFELPARVSAEPETATSTYCKFVVEPFEKGFGHTIGNGLRRVLLSSIEGAAITQIKIDGVLHEFSTLDGVLEDVVEIVLNVKSVLLRMTTPGPITLRVDVTREGPVTAGDIQCPNDIEILNPDYLICSLTAQRQFRMELEAQRGRGYCTAEDNEKDEKEIGVIAVDSTFSPVIRVRYKVEDTRVGKITNYDRLVLEIWTSGIVTPEAALVEASKIYRKHLNPFIHYLHPSGTILATSESDFFGSDGPNFPQPVSATMETADRGILDQSLSVLDLSVRARNCLDAENIRTVGQLVRMTEADLMELRNFGQTSLREVRRKLGALGIALAGSSVLVESEPEPDSESESAVISLEEEQPPTVSESDEPEEDS